MTILIIPTISAGNIPQLAIDLLIYSCNAKFFKALDDKYVYPFAGPRDRAPGFKDDGAPLLSTPIEVYKTANDIYLLQMRSPPLPGKQELFFKDTLLPLVHEIDADEVIVASSSNSAMQTHTEASQRFKLYSDSISQRLKNIKLHENSVVLSPEPVPIELNESGYLISLLKSTNDTSIPMSGLVIFAYEGDNFEDAEEFAGKLANIAGIERPTSWIRPFSWKGVYGKEVPIGLEEGLYA